jgi:putative tricarboxylic transport membrane protein
MFEVVLVIGFGVLGYLMMKLDYPPVPLVLGMILGPILERGIRRTLVASDGDLSVFFQSPIALVILLITVVLLAAPRFLQKRLPNEPTFETNASEGK